MRRACGRGAAGVCVYCAQPFCTEHGAVHPNYYEVCARKACLAKFADVEAHHRWLHEHRDANRMSMCAEDGCLERMEHACQRCRLNFCGQHLFDRSVTERRVDGVVRLVQLMCAHCAGRRALWD